MTGPTFAPDNPPTDAVWDATRTPSLSTAASDVTAVLLARRWVQARTSPRAALWLLPSTEAELYVPHTLRRDTLEWEGVLERIAAPTAENPRDIEKAIEQSNFDVIRYRVNATGETIPLETAATVIASAFGMIRAAATAARKPQQHITNYLKSGDKLAEQARLGHTEVGSFVFPVFLHIDEPALASQETLDGVDEVAPESDERRVTRTLAQALATFERQVIRPGTEPTAKSLMPVVYAGGTKELLSKVAATLAEPDIAFLETSFTWAGAEPAGRDMPTAVAIPAEAHRLVADAARVLGESRKDPLRVLVGPIIRIEHDVDDPFGEVVIQAAPSGAARKSRVEVRVRASQLGELHDWMHAGTTVVVQGKVERKPGRYARLKDVGAPQPLSATLEGLDA